MYVHRTRDCISCILAIMITAIIAACTPVASGPSIAEQEAMGQHVNQVCDLTKEPRLATLRGLIPLNIDEFENPSFTMLTTARVPTPEEAETLTLLDQMMEPCRDAGAQFSQIVFRSVPELVSMASVARSAIRLSLAKLARGEQTFAQHNETAKGMLDEFELSANRIIAMHETQRVAAADAARRAYVQAILTRPTYTNCTAVANSISCSTH